MPTAIYISGLGQSTNKESVEKYAARYIKELEYSTSRINYYTKVEKNLLQRNAPILLGRLQIRTILHKINMQQNEGKTILGSQYLNNKKQII